MFAISVTKHKQKFCVAEVLIVYLVCASKLNNIAQRILFFSPFGFFDGGSMKSALLSFRLDLLSLCLIKDLDCVPVCILISSAFFKCKRLYKEM